MIRYYHLSYLFVCGLKHSILSKILHSSPDAVMAFPYPPATYICPPYSAAHAPIRPSIKDFTKYQQFEDGSKHSTVLRMLN